MKLFLDVNCDRITLWKNEETHIFKIFFAYRENFVDVLFHYDEYTLINSITYTKFIREISKHSFNFRNIITKYKTK
jgi:hypothetical protein